MFQFTRRQSFLATLLLVLALLPLLEGQEKSVFPVKFAPSAAKGRDLSQLSIKQRHFYLSAQRGTDWLQRANKPDGRFVNGYLPALRVPMEGDQYLRQVGATWALARGAKFFNDGRATAIARQALLTLLLETTAADDAKIRHSTPPTDLLNRCATAGMLLLAIHDLPSPAQDLLDQGEQLACYLQRQCQKDGSLALLDDGETTDEAIQHYSGPALHGIVRSRAPWKLDYLRQARAYYHGYWQQKKNMQMVPPHTAAYAEAFALTRDQAFAETVFALNDWLCTLQYSNLDPRRNAWTGGFMPWIDGKAVHLAPDIRSAAAAESLADACRTAQLAGDVARQKRYKDALESALQFLATLQYTEGNTQHFADWYRPLLVGGFYASPQEGNLRLDYTQHALGALLQYLQHVAELPS